MSVQYVRDVYNSGLSGTLRPLAILIAFRVLDDASARRKGKDPRRLYMTIAWLAKCLDVREKTVRQHLRELVDLGVLTVPEGLQGGGRKRYGSRLVGRATTYEFHPDALPEADSTLPEKVGVAAPVTLPETVRVAFGNPPEKVGVAPGNPPEKGRGYIEKEDPIEKPEDPIVSRNNAGASLTPRATWLLPAGVHSTEGDE